MERLSGLDASFLYMETPTMPMQVAFVAICDTRHTPGGYSFPKLVERIESRVLREPAFRRRLVEVPFNLNHPLWMDDPDFNILNHIRQYTLPAPGSMRDLGKMVGQIMTKPLDRCYPLWEAWVVEGLEENRIALIIKVHHAAVDGVSGTALINHLFDKSDDVLELKPPAKAPTESVPGDRALVYHALRSRVKNAGGLATLLKQTYRGVRSYAGRHSGKQEQEAQLPLTAPRTHFNHRIGKHRDVAFAQLSLREVKAIKRFSGATVNDVVLAICGGVLRRYLLQHNDLPEKSLISMVPISVRRRDQMSQVNNQVSGMWATLGTHIADPLQRLRAIHQDTECAKQDIDAIGATILRDWAEFNTPGAFNLAVRLYTSLGLVERMAPVHNTIISNVPGPHAALYMAGNKIEAMYPLGPVMEGVGVNISLASYGDCVGFAIHVDKDLVQDVGEIAALFAPVFAEFKQAVGLQSAPSGSEGVTALA